MREKKNKYWICNICFSCLEKEKHLTEEEFTTKMFNERM